MIKNEREYRITNAAAEKFRASLAEARGQGPPKGVHPKLYAASLEAMRAQLKDLERELRDYDELKAGRPRLEARLEALGSLLIRARVARGWTQRELGDRVGLKMQQIQQYEATEYASASLTRIREMLQALGAVCEIQAQLLALDQVPRDLIVAGRNAAYTGKGDAKDARVLRPDRQPPARRARSRAGARR